ncbi:hypothetical protein SBA4_2670013 [Candidatus Sulfopaludibacter sp. SbA4]|nr:hypothetical protein SBA4_2670013 [Candidatus Sulfopaludibacter sp. SbA4]
MVAELLGGIPLGYWCPHGDYSKYTKTLPPRQYPRSRGLGVSEGGAETTSKNWPKNFQPHPS